MTVYDNSGCRERLAKLQAAVQPAEGVETYSPAVNEKSMRMALTKQIRDLHDEVPAYQRLGALRRQAPNKDQGGSQCWLRYMLSLFHVWSCPTLRLITRISVAAMA